MGKKKPAQSMTGMVKVIVSLAIAVTTVTAGTWHREVPSPRPPTVCTELQVGYQSVS